MSEILSTVKVSPLLSPRTTKYVEAMTLEGDNFDYDEWLKRVRQEDAEAKQAELTAISNELTAAEIDKFMQTTDGQRARPKPSLRLIPKRIRVPRTLRLHRQAKSQTPKTRLTRWLGKIRGAWGEFQGSRARDAVYGYLEEVFAIVVHFKLRRRTHRPRSERH